MTSSDAELAVALARTAGELLLTLRASALIAGAPLGAAGDAVANAWLVRALAALRPQDGLLSEESLDDRRRLEHARVWIVDPLDGTREYSEGRDDWAVHVALCVDGVPGPSAVAIPARGEVFGGPSQAPPPPRTAGAPIRIAVSRSRPPAVAAHVATALGAELVPLGSAGYKAMAVISGEVDAYLHDGGQHEWDSAAPVGVARAAGLHATRIDGSPLHYNRPDPLLPDLLIARAELAAPLLDAVAAFAGEPR